MIVQNSGCGASTLPVHDNSSLVILVNDKDEWVGSMEKMAAHAEGLLHRAFSVFILNSRGEMLLQCRAQSKYHSGGLWTNACCSHPRPGESTLAAAHRRLKEELNFDTALEKAFTMPYKAEVGNDLIENEVDHIYLGQYDAAITPNPEEVSETKYVSLEAIGQWMREKPEDFTAWFKLAFPKILKIIQSSLAA